MDLGTYFIIRVNEPVLSDHSIKILEQLKPIGVHFGPDAFLKDSYYSDWFLAFKELKSSINTATARNKMIFSIDHEGGRVNRLPTPISKIPYPLNWQERSSEIGNIVGKELASLGINLLFGPSLDIFSESKNQVIGPRAFGRTEKKVIQYALPYIQAVLNHGVNCVPKHFPGHGATIQDSHFELPELNLTLEELENRELLPFKAAIAAHLAPAIMIAHILFSSIDPEHPASFSTKICQDVLRDHLGFSGVLISDDLDMLAVKDKYTPPEIAKITLDNSLDLLIFNHHPERALQVADNLNVVIKDRQNAHQEHLQRIDILINKLTFNPPYLVDDQTLKSHEELLKIIPENYDPKIKEFTGA
jgi:beta-N-acetylhexosaminidase